MERGPRKDPRPTDEVGNRCLSELALASIHHRSRPAPPITLDDLRSALKARLTEKRSGG